MKFGIFVFGDNHPELGRSNQKYYEEVLTMAEWAEELGFDSFWLGEHHLYWYGTLVSPPTIIAALGQRTKKIRLGPAVSVPSFHNPLVLAEEYAFADNLCGGRLEFALGSGFSPVEFKTFGMTMEEAKETFLGSDRRHPKSLAGRGIFPQGQILSVRQRNALRETGAKANAADLARGVERRHARQSRPTGLADDGYPIRALEQSRSM